MLVYGFDVGALGDIVGEIEDVGMPKGLDIDFGFGFGVDGKVWRAGFSFDLASVMEAYAASQDR